jgi:hypothetical protein
MSRLDEMAKSAPVEPSVVTGPIPAHGSQANPANAFAEVTVMQLYFFLWKWAGAFVLFALPFVILLLLLHAASRH